MSYLYQKIADEMIHQIQSGLLTAGQRLPGVKRFSLQKAVSVATALAAYRVLENAGYVEARDRSGFYVKARREPQRAVAQVHTATSQPALVTGQQMALELTKKASDEQMVQLGAAVPHRSFLPERQMTRALSNVLRCHPHRLTGYEMPPGAPELRVQIARRMAEMGCRIQADEVLVTSGCQEALRLALRAVCEPGDVVAIESPIYYGALQVLESLRLEVVEIPTDPQQGISVEALGLAFETWSVKALLVSASVQNPLGFTMTDARKKQMVSLASSHSVTVIEDDIYGDLYFGGGRPAPLKSEFPDADIIYCNSFSKTLSPGMRVGWMVSSLHWEKIEYLKYVSNIATGSAAQLAVADYLASGGFDRYLRQARSQYFVEVERMSQMVMRYFPSDVKLTEPTGGYVLWVQCNSQVDTFALARASLAEGIALAPGSIFSASLKYSNCMRLSCACTWNSKTEFALQTLGRLISEQLSA